MTEMNPPLNVYDAGAILGFVNTDRAPAEDRQCAELTALIRRMATGDEAALGRFYDLTLPRVYGLAMRIAGRRELAEEVCVETYWQSWREAIRYDTRRGHPLAWLMVMARTRALDALRRQNDAREDPETCLEGEPSPEPSPLDHLLQLETSGALREALAALTPIQRELVALVLYKDLSHQEISDRTGLPLGTVKSHLKRAQDGLRKALFQA
ncbi:MAG: sigma-70 family RNA polymerase sigma factor [Desulfuromonadia bacterium]